MPGALPLVESGSCRLTNPFSNQDTRPDPFFCIREYRRGCAREPDVTHPGQSSLYAWLHCTWSVTNPAIRHKAFTVTLEILSHRQDQTNQGDCLPRKRGTS
ncbi:hypothetical protein DBV39_16700 [Orrella marina]|uniref:Uncharacterized protein n=1 Tax=Orrella marina TaxID=2163011 RepID=A0A2R4XMR0_9BURK|nr:hypothetical protein DBV39_16700 [Orrella marina]